MKLSLASNRRSSNGRSRNALDKPSSTVTAQSNSRRIGSSISRLARAQTSRARSERATTMMISQKTELNELLQRTRAYRKHGRVRPCSRSRRESGFCSSAKVSFPFYPIHPADER